MNNYHDGYIEMTSWWWWRYANYDKLWWFWWYHVKCYNDANYDNITDYHGDWGDGENQRMIIMIKWGQWYDDMKL